jgi:hypothetical protein
MNTNKKLTRRCLEGLRLAISISSSPDLARLGFGEMHLHDAFVELARYILASGGSPAYGGDLRPNGYTELLFDLYKTYSEEVPGLPGLVHNYLSWPLSLRLDTTYRASLKGIVDFHEVPPPPDVKIDKTVFLPPDSLESRAIWARCLTEMREKMTEECDGRVIIGGAVTGFLGCYPGIMEEAAITILKNKPLYIVGGLGGCSAAIASLILGSFPQEFKEDFQFGDEKYKMFVSEYNVLVDQRKIFGKKIEWETMTDFFKKVGISGLKNGLSEVENRRLFLSENTHEIVSLIMNGLGRVRVC